MITMATCCRVAQDLGGFRCPICRKAVRVLVVHREPGGDVVGRELPITEAQCRAYADGAYLQDAFPNLSQEDREFIKSGFSLEPPDDLADVVDDVTRSIDAWPAPVRDYAMEPNPNGHPYGCGCDECMEFYRSLK